MLCFARSGVTKTEMHVQVRQSRSATAPTFSTRALFNTVIIRVDVGNNFPLMDACQLQLLAYMLDLCPEATCLPLALSFSAP